MTKKIMLIKPPLYVDAVFDPIRTTQPTGLWYIASYLKEKGYDVSIFDTVVEGIDERVMLTSKIDYNEFQRKKSIDLENLSAEEFVKKYSPHDLEGNVSREIVRVGLSDEEILSRIREQKPEYIGITCIATCNHSSTVDLAKLIKSNFPNIKIIVGGSHATEIPEQLLRDSEGAIDFCVKGDGQFVLEEIMQGKIPETGIAYLENNKLVETKEYRRMRMSEFSLLDPSLLENIIMPMPATHTYDTENRKYVEFMASRGCRGTCGFCSAGSKNAKSLRETGELCYGFDKRELYNVEAQLKIFKEQGYEEIILQDDDLLADKDYFISVISLFKKYGFKWQDNGGVAFEDLDSRVVDAIIENGNCTALYIPFNPRSDKISQATKRVSNKHSKNLELCKRLKDSGIYTYTSAIFGMDCQNREDLESEIEVNANLIRQGFFDQALLFGLSYLPGTKYYELNKKDIINPNDWIGYSIFVPHAKTATIGIRDVEIAVVRANQVYNKTQKQAKPWGSSFPK